MNSARAEANNTTVRMLTRRGFGYHSADALIAITMLKRSGLCPDLPGRPPRHTSPQTAKPPDQVNWYGDAGKIESCSGFGGGVPADPLKA